MDDKRRLILDQALALVDERGLAAMSMRAVAERVGLTSMALYPYVGGKDALLDGLVDLLHLELGTSVGDNPADIDWRVRLRALGRAVRALSRAHPSAFPLLLTRSAAGASASWLTAALRGILHDAGVPDPEAPRLSRMICAFLLGYTTGEVTGGLPRVPPPDPRDPGPADPTPSQTPLSPTATPTDPSTPPARTPTEPPATSDRTPTEPTAISGRTPAEPTVTSDRTPAESSAISDRAPAASSAISDRAPAASNATSGRASVEIGAVSKVASAEFGEADAAARDVEFDADLEDLVSLVEHSVHHHAEDRH